MYTQCPHCQTCFRISEAHLKVADGKVRCGSCQEVFDATQHLFKNLIDREPITYFKQESPPPPVPSPPPPAAPAPQQSATDHIDLSGPAARPEQTPEDIRRERSETPDQGHFMESVVGSDRYNDLDQMGSISIPGDINFGDSIIKFAEAEQEPAGEPDKPAEDRTPYEDFADKESPATTADLDSIKDFYAQVDAQLSDKGEQAEDKRSQLDKDIDELLAFAKGLDQESDLTKTEQSQHDSADRPTEHVGSEIEEEFDLHAIAEFEKELEATNAGVFAAQALPTEQTQNKDHADGKPAQTEKTSGKPRPAKATTKATDELSSFSEADTSPAKSDGGKRVKHNDFDELPSPDEDIPLALRRSLDSLNDLPRRSLGMTLLMLLIILVLIGGLGFQVVLFRNVELAQRFPRLIPLLTQVCDRLPCRYSGKVDVSQIKLLSRDVRSHPTQANALLISAAFANQAPFDQPYPIIQITLYDLGGNVVASRRFTPQEYLEAMYNRFLLMESGTPVHITLAVLDPGKDAINFEFTFLQDMVH